MLLGDYLASLVLIFAMCGALVYGFNNRGYDFRMFDYLLLSSSTALAFTLSSVITLVISCVF